MAKRTDLLVHGEGSICLLRPSTRRRRQWVDEHVSTDRLEWAGAVVVEHRFIGDLVNVDHDEDEDDIPRCPECGEISPCEFQRRSE
jgi:hypothetical protein